MISFMKSKTTKLTPHDYSTTHLIERRKGIEIMVVGRTAAQITNNEVYYQ
jgi:hypothetical protein